MKNLENYGVQELELSEMQNIDGSFIPLVIFGVAYTAAQVATGMGIAFGAGVTIGAAAYLAGR
ncbi:hypothetical protein SAMN02927921_01324 [Sinomicrobium oceani]|uniref:Class IIb bacteriocin, lactobin A/cerein 7B family n=1 Tax=Sinomicrobium oceani TaxID=1150368 RepID=A0A1K1NM27_9FLAO|nr:hypothetical protein [Sinomicrobium oceani]SFW36339.1 hypothetical protein SAMN02927921_01324 [Sinomicrobium oceani]